jgi:hypothetical protein
MFIKNLPHQNFRLPTTGNIIGVPQKNDESFVKPHNQDFRKSDVADPHGWDITFLNKMNVWVILGK